MSETGPRRSRRRKPEGSPWPSTRSSRAERATPARRREARTRRRRSRQRARAAAKNAANGKAPRAKRAGRREGDDRAADALAAAAPSLRRGRRAAAALQAAARSAAPTPPRRRAPPPPRAAIAPRPQPAAPTPAARYRGLARNIARLIEEGGKVAAAYLAPRETRRGQVELRRRRLATRSRRSARSPSIIISDPQRAFQAQAALSSHFMTLWAATLRRLQGERRRRSPRPTPATSASPTRNGATNPYFDFLAQAYVHDDALGRTISSSAPTISIRTRATRRNSICGSSTGALSPSNFVATSPELMRTTLAESGENLVRGMHMMAEDIEAGHGNLRIRQTDASKFKLGDEHGGDAGQGGLPQRSDGADPICADDAERLQAPAADRAAVDQQILRARSQSREILRPLGGGAGPDRLRHLLGQSRRAPRGQGLRAYMREGDLRRARRASSWRPASAKSRRSAIASAARCWR